MRNPNVLAVVCAVLFAAGLVDAFVWGRNIFVLILSIGALLSGVASLILHHTQRVRRIIEYVPQQNHGTCVICNKPIVTDDYYIPVPGNAARVCRPCIESTMP